MHNSTDEHAQIYVIISFKKIRYDIHKTSIPTNDQVKKLKSEPNNFDQTWDDEHERLFIITSLL